MCILHDAETGALIGVRTPGALVWTDSRDGLVQWLFLHGRRCLGSGACWWWGPQWCFSGPVVAQIELERHELDSPVGNELTDNRVATYEHAGGDHHAVIRSPGNQLGKTSEVGGEPLDDGKELEHLEVVG